MSVAAHVVTVLHLLSRHLTLVLTVVDVLSARYAELNQNICNSTQRHLIPVKGI